MKASTPHPSKASTVTQPIGGHACCVSACTLFDQPDMHVRAAELTDRGWALSVETRGREAACPDCGVIAARAKDRDRVLLHDLPAHGVPVRLVWSKRRWRCQEPACARTSFTEPHPVAAPRARLTTRAVAWCADQIASHDITVSALAGMLGVAWHTVWNAVAPMIRARIADPARLEGVRRLGVDEHIWTHVGLPGRRAVTGIIDHTPDEDGRPRARLLDLVPGRSGAAYQGWLARQSPAFRDGVTTATLDPFRGYANAIPDQLPATQVVLDAFHIVKLGTQMVDEVRRRVQQNTTGHRGRAGDPLYRIRRALTCGVEHLTERQAARLEAGLAAGDPHDEVLVAWQCYQKLRAVYHQPTSTTGRALAVEVIDSLHTCPIPEVARLGRTLRRWREEILAYFHTNGASNGPTEAVNGVIETMRRVARGFRNPENYRLRALMAAGGHRPWRTP